MMRRRTMRTDTLSALLAALALPVTAAAQSYHPGPPIELRMTPDAAPLSAAAQASMIALPGGRYPMGSPDGRPSARLAHEVALAPFAIDRTEVTNAAFAEFLNALDLDVRRDFA